MFFPLIFFQGKFLSTRKELGNFFNHVKTVSINSQCLWETEALYTHHLSWSTPGAHELAYILYGTSRDQWNQASKVTNHRVRLGTRSYHMLESSHTTIPECLCPLQIWSWNATALRNDAWTGEMAQREKALDAKSEDLRRPSYKRQAEDTSMAWNL